MAEAGRSTPRLRLRLVSSATLAPTLALAERCGLDPELIEAHTCSDWERVCALIQECDVAVLPRRVCRGFPIKLLNYMALGLPVVACEGSAKLLRDGEDGLVVPFEPSAFAAAMLELVSDPNRAFRMGARARSATLREQDWRHRVPEFERVYAATLESH